MEFHITKIELLRRLRFAQHRRSQERHVDAANVLLRTESKNPLLVAAANLNVSLTAELKSINASGSELVLGVKICTDART
jgi:hypothetical protein